MDNISKKQRINSGTVHQIFNIPMETLNREVALVKTFA